MLTWCIGFISLQVRFWRFFPSRAFWIDHSTFAAVNQFRCINIIWVVTYTCRWFWTWRIAEALWRRVFWLILLAVSISLLRVFALGLLEDWFICFKGFKKVDRFGYWSWSFGVLLNRGVRFVKLACQRFLFLRLSFRFTSKVDGLVVDERIKVFDGLSFEVLLVLFVVSILEGHFVWTFEHMIDWIFNLFVSKHLIVYHVLFRFGDCTLKTFFNVDHSFELR